MRQSYITVRGRTEAKRAVHVRAETQGRVVELPVEKGQPVKTGDVLCRLRSMRAMRSLPRRARRAAAQARI